MMVKILRSIHCGKTSGIYLIALGAVVIVSMIFRGISQARLDLDLSPVLLFLGGYLLINYNNTARKWVIGISVVGAIAIIMFAILMPFIGTNNVTVDLLFFDIEAPSFATAYGALLAGLIMFAIPLVLLYNDKARQEFERTKAT